MKLEKGDFVGRDALARAAKAPGGSRIGLVLRGRRIARQGSTVLQNDQPIGRVTSGTFSPTLGRSLAMALVTATEASAIGSELAVDVRGQREAAEVVPLPFYRRPRA